MARSRSMSLIGVAASAVLLASVPGESLRAQEITEAEATSIGVDAYLYFYPLITMDITRRQLTSAGGDPGISGPPNTFANVRAFPTATMRSVVRPNFDTLYSSAWLDLTKEPMIVSVPDTGGRYYLLPIWICGPTYSHRRAGARREREPETFLSCHQAGPGTRAVQSCQPASRPSKPPRRMFGSSDAQRPTGLRTTTRCTRCRTGSKSRRYPSGTNRRSLSP